MTDPVIYRGIAQGSAEWHALRVGIPTASCFSDVLAKGEGKTRSAYMRRLAAERITGEPGEIFSSSAMDRGKAMEDEARKAYSLIMDVDCEQVTFIRNGDIGCSPDSLIGDNAGLEIKTTRGDKLIEMMARNVFPSEHIAQTQGFLLVAEREWTDLLVYWPRMAPFIKRAYRDENYISTLRGELARFNDELAAMVEWVKAYDSGTPTAQTKGTNDVTKSLNARRRAQPRLDHGGPF